MPSIAPLLKLSLVSVALLHCEGGQLRCGETGVASCVGSARSEDPTEDTGPLGEADTGDARLPFEPVDAAQSLVDVGVRLPDGGQIIDTGGQTDVGGGCAELRPDRVGVDVSGGEQGPLGTHEIELAGSSVLIHVPPCYEPVRAFGLAIVLHDLDGNREYLWIKWGPASRDREYIVLLPQGKPTFDNNFNWLDHRPGNKAVILAAVEYAESHYQIDRGDTLLAGLGGAATSFALDLVSETPADQPFEYLLLVNLGGEGYDPSIENWFKVFVLQGLRDHPPLADRTGLPRFRYHFAPSLGPFYPGPPYPQRRDDPAFQEVTNETAIDWFHGWDLTP